METEGNNKIDKEIIKRYYDMYQILNFDLRTARAEEKIIIPHIMKKTKPTVLDLGCGNGRYATMLGTHYKKYTGVDFSLNFIDACRTKQYENCKFIWDNVEDFCKGKYDIILLFGVLIYLNDSDIKKLARHCNKMLHDDGFVLVRDLLADKKTIKNIEGYQRIRRSECDYYGFFNDAGFYCAKQFKIPETGFTGFIFMKKEAERDGNRNEI